MKIADPLPIGDTANLDALAVVVPATRYQPERRISARAAVMAGMIAGIRRTLPPWRILLAFCARHNARIVNAKR